MIQWRSCGVRSLTTTTTTFLPWRTQYTSEKTAWRCRTGRLYGCDRCGQCLRYTWPVFGQKIGMPFGNVTLPFLCQLDLTVQVGTRKPPNHASPFCIRRLTAQASAVRGLLRVGCMPLFGRTL